MNNNFSNKIVHASFDEYCKEIKDIWIACYNMA